jgi:hypothetical protein
MSESSDADGQSSESGAGTRSDDESDDEAVVAQPVAAPARRHRRRKADVRLADDATIADDPTLPMPERTKRAWQRFDAAIFHAPDDAGKKAAIALFPDPHVFTDEKESQQAVANATGWTCRVALVAVQQLHCIKKDFHVGGVKNVQQARLKSWYQNMTVNVQKQDALIKAAATTKQQLDELKAARQSRFTKSEGFRTLAIFMDPANKEFVERYLAKKSTRAQLDGDGPQTFESFVPRLFNNKDYRPAVPALSDYALPDDVDMNGDDISWNRSGYILNNKYTSMKSEYNIIAANFRRSGQNKTMAEFLAGHKDVSYA